MARKEVETGFHEHIKENSAKGFDTPGMIPGWLKTALIAAVIVAVIIGGMYVLGGGERRNCILSVMGNDPDCSDNDGTLKDTYANGRYVGECTGLDNAGNCLK